MAVDAFYTSEFINIGWNHKFNKKIYYISQKTIDWCSKNIYIENTIWKGTMHERDHM